jgi:hypothetical protein
MNHHIVECVIGNGEKQLPPASGIQTIYTQNLLWHKEALLNYTIKNLPEKYRYVFWVDADVLFTNKNWLVDSVHELKNGANVVQPFEYCVHLEKDELKPKFNLQAQIPACGTKYRHPNVWRSFCANYVDKQEHWQSKDYNTHGHTLISYGCERSSVIEINESGTVLWKWRFPPQEYVNEKNVQIYRAEWLPNKLVDVFLQTR